MRALGGGFGVHSVRECIGLDESMRTAMSIARPGGAVGRVGVLQGDESRSTAGSITALGGKAVSETN